MIITMSDRQCLIEEDLTPTGAAEDMAPPAGLIAITLLVAQKTVYIFLFDCSFCLLAHSKIVAACPF
jgi:hypothetical protein